jgi:hypothetical protein
MAAISEIEAENAYPTYVGLPKLRAIANSSSQY